MGKYREHMRRSLGLKICWKMEIKVDETYHVASGKNSLFHFLHSIGTVKKTIFPQNASCTWVID